MDTTHLEQQGEAVPAPLVAVTTAALAQLSIEQGHQTTTSAGHLALCAMALAVIVRVAVKMPHGSPERRALAGAAATLRRVV